MPHAHERPTDEEQALVDQARQDLADYLNKVVKASMTPDVLARFGFEYNGYDGPARKWKLRIEKGARIITSEGTLHFGVSRYIGTTKVKEQPDATP
jgi:hypothetical protein